MSLVENFIQSSDYASLKNDNVGTFTLYIGGSPALNDGDKYTYEAFYDMGRTNAGIRCQLSTDVAPTVFWSSASMSITLSATVSGGGGTSDYPTTVYVERISATRMRLVCNVYGIAAGLTTTITGKYQTITANIATFLSPFN
jgi:hypothetical protein